MYKRQAILQLDRGKANTINQTMVNEIRASVKALAVDETVGGLILIGKRHFFSAGLDLIEIYDYDKVQMLEFLISFSQMHIELARFPKPLIAAINGHSPAGGTVIAITADYRIMVEGEKYIIGLNEVAVNIQISQMLVNAYAFWIGKAKAHQYILDGKLLNTTEALACGLVNELVTEENLLARAEEKMNHYLSADPDIFKNSKAKVRKYWLDEIDKYSEADLEQAQLVWWKPAVRAKMKLFVDKLAKR